MIQLRSEETGIRLVGSLSEAFKEARKILPFGRYRLIAMSSGCG